MPETQTYGFEFETPQSKPGITLTGDIDGSAPILAEQVDAVIAGIDSRVTANEGDIVAMQDLIASDTGWVTLSITAGTGFTATENVYRQWGPIVAIRLMFTRTGAAITANSSGNVGGDPLVCTINTVAVRPDRQQNIIGRCTNTSGSVGVGTSGPVNLLDLHSNSMLDTNDEIRISATYFVAAFV